MKNEPCKQEFLTNPTLLHFLTTNQSLLDQWVHLDHNGQSSFKILK